VGVEQGGCALITWIYLLGEKILLSRKERDFNVGVV